MPTRQRCITICGRMCRTTSGRSSTTCASTKASDNVLLFMFSEFGRRISDNGSGTDHGAAGVAFAVGEHVKGGIYGTYPSLQPSEQEEGGNLKHNMDFRSVYSTILEDWLGLNPAPIIGGRLIAVKFLRHD